MSNKFILRALCCFAAFQLASCKQSDPPPLIETGDLYFSGYYWNIKNSDNTQVGPGPNRFSNSSANVWLDTDNMLHLRITKRNNQWFCSEVISVREFGYGTYKFVTASDLTTFTEKEVLGLFTWNNYSFQTQGNSEVDIEFARWNDGNDSLLLTYSVQPVWFSNPSPYIERTQKPQMKVSELKGVCTHLFEWTPSLITWKSYRGESVSPGNLIAEWSYDSSNQPRNKMEGNLVSDPIVIPAPEDSTNARINLWLLFGQPPANNQETEVVIKSFQHTPL